MSDARLMTDEERLLMERLTRQIDEEALQILRERRAKLLADPQIKRALHRRPK